MFDHDQQPEVIIFYYYRHQRWQLHGNCYKLNLFYIRHTADKNEKWQIDTDREEIIKEWRYHSRPGVFRPCEPDLQLAPSLPECPLRWRRGWHTRLGRDASPLDWEHVYTRNLASTELPHRQEWGLPSSEPRLSATSMRTASSSSRSPQAVISNAKSQSPLCVARAATARRLARWNGELRVSSTAVESNNYLLLLLLFIRM